MKTNIRIAKISDAPEFMKIKDQLSFKRIDGSTTTGGFLLGTTMEMYHAFIEKDYCLVAEKNNELIGFGILLKDEQVRKSEMWTRRHKAVWTIDIEQFEEKRICYFEQLAFLPGHSRDVFSVAYNLACWAFEEGHDHMFTTTVHKPILNLAAVPYILRSSGSLVGSIDEYYSMIGAITSDIYKIDAVSFYEAVRASHFLSFLQSHYIPFHERKNIALY